MALLHVDMQSKKLGVTKDLHDPVCAVDNDLVDDSRAKYFTQYLREWYVLLCTVYLLHILYNQILFPRNLCIVASSQSSECVAIQISKEANEENFNMFVVDPQDDDKRLILPINDGMHDKIIEIIIFYYFLFIMF